MTIADPSTGSPRRPGALLEGKIAVHYGPHGIRANAVAPGFTLSEKNLAAPPEIMRELGGKAAPGRAGRPEEQAHVAAFLASDLVSSVTGAVVPVDGGWPARLA